MVGEIDRPSKATTEELLCIETSRQGMKHAIVTSSIGTLLQIIKKWPWLVLHNWLIMLIYTNDCITTAKSLAHLKKMIVNLASSFEITDEGDVDEYLGLEMEWQVDIIFKLSQLLLIGQIIMAKGYIDRIKPTDILALAKYFTETCKRELKNTGTAQLPWKLSRPNIAYTIHQCTRFAAHQITTNKN